MLKDRLPKKKKYRPQSARKISRISLQTDHKSQEEEKEPENEIEALIRKIRMEKKRVEESLNKIKQKEKIDFSIKKYKLPPVLGMKNPPPQINNNYNNSRHNFRKKSKSIKKRGVSPSVIRYKEYLVQLSQKSKKSKQMRENRRERSSKKSKKLFRVQSAKKSRYNYYNKYKPNWWG